MALSSGTRVGPYEIIAPVGAGGMGQVYRAHDARLGRDVAVKVLPAELAENAQFKARFDREAKTISKLSHPNICALFDVGENYLVMEFLEGESLADRLTRGPLALHEVLKVGVQIAEALGRAHREGIIHRDLKPANIMLTKSGAKLLDFGLAKDRVEYAVTDADATRLKSLTAEGSILGTFPYMAPELLAGEQPDARTDVFALGTVLYEMTTGTRAFDAVSNRDLLAAIVSGEPAPIHQLQPLAPPALVHVVARCLPKDPEDRWQNAMDIAEELRWIAQGLSQALPAAPLRQSKRFGLRTSLIAAAAGWLLFVAALVAGGILLRQSTAARHVFQTELGRGNLAQAFTAPLAISPNGALLASVSVQDGAWYLLLRDLRIGEARVLGGTEGASFPFWSPDGRAIGFFANGKLKTINVETGATQIVCDAPAGRGGSWNQHGVILFAPDLYTSLFTVPATGGAPVAVTTLPAGDKRSHRNPYFLPDGEHFLFSSVTRGNGVGGTTMAGSLKTGAEQTVFDYASGVAYSDDHLFSVRNGALLVHDFDARHATLNGPPRPISDDVDWYVPRGTATFAVAGNVLVYAPAFRPKMRFAVGDRSGKLDETGEAATYKVIHVSPDGRAVSSNRYEESQREFSLVVMDLSSGTSSRLISSGPSGESNAVFAPDGTRAVIDVNVGDTHELWTQPVAGGSREVLVKGDEYVRASDWSHDGKVIVFERQHPGTGWDIEYVMLNGQIRPAPFLKTAASESGGRLSPDQRWLAFVSDEGGNSDVYVTSFPSAQVKWRISTNGGTSPRWSADGRTLHYLAHGTIQALDVRPGPGFTTGQSRPVEMFGHHVTTFDVMHDGRLVALRTPDQPPPPLKVVVNWRELLPRN